MTDALVLQQLAQLTAISQLNTDGVSEAEATEQLGPILKAISENKKEDALINELDGFLEKKEKEIEKMCNNNYQEFVQSVDKLINVRRGTVQLQKKIVDYNSELQHSVSRLAAKKKDLIEARRVQQNVETAIEALQSSLLVLELANRINGLVETGRYYAALRTLDELQTQHLRPVTGFAFAQYLEKSVPVMQTMIKDAVIQDMREWLVKVRDHSRHIGRLAISHMQERQERWRHRTLQGPTLRGLAHHHVNSAIEKVVNEGDESNILDEVNIDFKPLFRCLHIHDSLGKRAEFRLSYEEDRRAQANLALSTPLNLRTGVIAPFETLLADVTGFFIIEHIIMHSTTDFRSSIEVDALWELVVGRIVSVVSQSLKGCEEKEVYLKVKLRLLIFILTVEGFGYPVKKLQETLLALFERYSDLLIESYSVNLEKIVAEDECMPMMVKDDQEYNDVLKEVRFKEDRKSMAQGFPRTLPFSKVFPACAHDVRIFVGQFYEFAEGFSQQHGEMDDILKKAVDNLLINKINGILTHKLQSQILSQVAQIIINLEYFEQACADFETLLMDTRSFHRAGVIRLKAASVFRETRRKGEKRIFELVNRKIDEAFELADYDFTPAPEYRLELGDASSYLQDLVSFLSVQISETLRVLPQSMKNFVYFEALDHLATCMKDMLISPSIPRINDTFVYNLDVDVRFLEDFVNSLDETNVGDAFLELRQIVTLIQCENAEEYLNSQIRNRKYSRIKPIDVIAFLDKLLKDNQASNLLNTREKQRRRSMETVVRTLRATGGNL